MGEKKSEDDAWNEAITYLERKENEQKKIEVDKNRMYIILLFSMIFFPMVLSGILWYVQYPLALVCFLIQIAILLSIGITIFFVLYLAWRKFLK